MRTDIFKFKKFHSDEEGIATVWAVFWLIICFALSGLAIDTANAWKIKQFLQSTADVSSVSAAMEFYFTNPDDDLEVRVKSVANEYATANMKESRYGDVLPDESIYLGFWDGTTFSPDLSGGTISPNAVRVVTEQVDDFSLGTFFLRFVGILNFDVRASSVAAYIKPGCDGAAILSQGNVMIEGNNSFSDFCIYGMQGVDVQASNFFGEDTLVGMAFMDDCGSGNSFDAHCTNAVSSSEGLAEALWYGDSGVGSEPSSLVNKLDASNNFFGGISGSFDEVSSLYDVAGLKIEIPTLIDTYLYESIYGPDGTTEDATFRDTAQTAYLNTNVVEVDMTPFTSKEDNQMWTDETGAITGVPVYNEDGSENVDYLVDAPLPIPPLYEAIVPKDGETFIPGTNYVAGTTYIVDCTKLDPTIDNKMSLGGHGGATIDLSGIAIIGLGCDYKFDTSISYSSAFITTTSDRGLKGKGRSSISSSAGALLGSLEPACGEDKFTLLTNGSVKFGSQLEGSNFDLVVAGTVNIASGSNSGEPVPHVGSSITAGGDVHISAHHIFEGCGSYEGAVPGNKNYYVSIVQ